MPQPQNYERIAVFTFGALFVVAVLVLAVAFPDPTPFQYVVFRIVLALAAAGVAAFVPGFLHVRLSTWLRAGGAMAVFAIVYFLSPVGLVHQPKVPKQGQEINFVTESARLVDDGRLLVHFTVWNRHPYEKVRLTNLRIHELMRIPTERYCCPETRSELSLKLNLDSKEGKASAAPLETTYEISPLSSHAFVARISVERGIADNNPVVWFGLLAGYSTPSGSMWAARSDRIFLANAERADVPVAFAATEVNQVTQESLGFRMLDAETALAWFGKTSLNR